MVVSGGDAGLGGDSVGEGAGGGDSGWVGFGVFGAGFDGFFVPPVQCRREPLLLLQ